MLFVCALLVGGALFCGPALAAGAATAAEPQQKKSETPQPVAGQPAPAGTVTVASASVPLNQDEDLARMHERFTAFAQAWVGKLNRNHTASRSRMKPVKGADGSFHGSYHQFDNNTIVCRVKRTNSKLVPFVGIIKYKERIYEVCGDSASACMVGNAQPVRTIGVTEIFNYRNGAWQ